MTRLVPVQAVCDGCSAAPATVFCTHHCTVLCNRCDATQHSSTTADTPTTPTSPTSPDHPSPSPTTIDTSPHPPSPTPHHRIRLRDALTALPFCDRCDDAPATVYCENDGTALCDRCDHAVHQPVPVAHWRTPVDVTLRHRTVYFPRLPTSSNPPCPRPAPSTPPVKRRSRRKAPVQQSPAPPQPQPNSSVVAVAAAAAAAAGEMYLLHSVSSASSTDRMTPPTHLSAAPDPAGVAEAATAAAESAAADIGVRFHTSTPTTPTPRLSSPDLPAVVTVQPDAATVARAHARARRRKRRAQAHAHRLQRSSPSQPPILTALLPSNHSNFNPSKSPTLAPDAPLPRLLLSPSDTGTSSAASLAPDPTPPTDTSDVNTSGALGPDAPNHLTDEHNETGRDPRPVAPIDPYASLQVDMANPASGFGVGIGDDDAGGFLARGDGIGELDIGRDEFHILDPVDLSPFEGNGSSMALTLSDMRYQSMDYDGGI